MLSFATENVATSTAPEEPVEAGGSAGVPTLNRKIQGFGVLDGPKVTMAGVADLQSQIGCQQETNSVLRTSTNQTSTAPDATLKEASDAVDTATLQLAAELGDKNAADQFYEQLQSSSASASNSSSTARPRRVLYDGDGLETILKHRFFQILCFPK